MFRQADPTGTDQVREVPATRKTTENSHIQSDDHWNTLVFYRKRLRIRDTATDIVIFLTFLIP